MKKLLSALLLTLLTKQVYSQAPPSINYQGIVRDEAGIPVFTLSTIGIKFEISNGSNTIVHNETQSAVPVNTLGIFNTKIGLSPVLSSTINWANGPFTLSVSVNSGSGFNFLGLQQLSSVPFALYAASAPVPTLEINGNSLSLTGGNSVILPGGTTYTNGSGIVITGSVISNALPDQTVTIANGTNVNVSGTYPNFTIDATPTLSLAGAELSISGGNSVTLPTGTTYTSGAGISLVSGTIITNTAPNQTVNINGPGVTGSYPNYTINSAPPVTITPGNSNITVSGSAPNYTVSSTPSLNLIGNNLSISNGNAVTLPPPPSPTITGSGIAVVTPTTGNNFSVTVASPTFTGAGTTTVTGSYPNYTISTPTTAAGWALLGNAATNPATNFVGTTDNAALNFRVNNLASGKIDPLGPTFFGYQAGIINTSIANTGFGYQTLYSNTSGNANTAVGYNSLFANTTGIRNSAFGSNALGANSTGTTNSAFGFMALRNNSTGNQNVAFGASALRDNTSGNDNTAFGTQALLVSSTGSNNTAVGSQVLNNNATGNYNTSSGYQSLYFNNTGGYNTAHGANALYTNPSGNQNTALGALAGYNNTGSGNVFIGYGAGFSATGSNLLYIANTSVGAPLIFGDFSAARIGLGTTSPTQKLDVIGNVQIPAANEYLYSSPKQKYLSVPVNALLSMRPQLYNLYLYSYVGGYDGESGYGYFNDGTSGANAIATAPVYLPDGATVTQLFVRYYDSDVTNDLTISLERKGHTTINNATMASFTSSGSSSGPSGAVTAAVNTITTPVIDNFNNAYYVKFKSKQATSSMGILDIRIAYTITKAD